MGARWLGGWRECGIGSLLAGGMARLEGLLGRVDEEGGRMIMGQVGVAKSSIHESRMLQLWTRRILIWHRLSRVPIVGGALAFFMGHRPLEPYLLS